MPSKYSCEFLFWLKQLILPILLASIFVACEVPRSQATADAKAIRDDKNLLFKAVSIDEDKISFETCILNTRPLGQGVKKTEHRDCVSAFRDSNEEKVVFTTQEIVNTLSEEELKLAHALREKVEDNQLVKSRYGYHPETMLFVDNEGHIQNSSSFSSSTVTGLMAVLTLGLSLIPSKRYLVSDEEKQQKEEYAKIGALNHWQALNASEKEVIDKMIKEWENEEWNIDSWTMMSNSFDTLVNKDLRDKVNVSSVRDIQIALGVFLRAKNPSKDLESSCFPDGCHLLTAAKDSGTD